MSETTEAKPIPKCTNRFKPGDYAILKCAAHSWDQARNTYALSIPKKTAVGIVEIGSVTVKVKDLATGAEEWVAPGDLDELKQLQFSMLEGDAMKDCSVVSAAEKPDETPIRGVAGERCYTTQAILNRVKVILLRQGALVTILSEPDKTTGFVEVEDRLGKRYRIHRNYLRAFSSTKEASDAP